MEQDDLESSLGIYMITKEQNLLLEFIDKITELEICKEYLIKLKETIGKDEQRPLTRTYDLNNIFNRFNQVEQKPATLQDLQMEINQLKTEINQIKDQIIQV